MVKNIIYTIIILLILFTPFVYSEELYKGVISAKQIWFYGVMGLLLGITGIFLLFPKKPLTFRLNIIDIALLAFYIYLLIRAAFTPYTPLLYNTKFINYTLLTGMYFILKYILTEDKKQTILKILSLVLILTGLGEAFWGMLQLYGFLPSFHSHFKITGTFYNPAPYALYLAVIFPLSLDYVINSEKLKIKNSTESCKGLISYIRYCYQFLILNYSLFIYYLSLATVVAILLVLPATMIRASWLAAIAGSLVVLDYKYHFIWAIKQFLSSKLKRVIAVILVFVVIGMLGLGLYHLKKGSSIGKLLIWEVTLGKIAERPLFGYGVGRFEAEYNNWQAEYFQKHQAEMDGPKGMAAGNTKYAFNEFLEITAETGIVGLLVFGLLLVSPVYDKSNYCHLVYFKISAYLLGGYTSFCFCALISFPYYSLPTQILFFIILAMLSFISKNGTILSLPKIVTAVPLILFSALLIIKEKKMYKVYYALDEANLLYQNICYPESSQSLYKIFPFAYLNGEYLQLYGKVLLMENRHLESRYILEQAKKYNSDQTLYINIGDCYKSLRQYKESEKAYLIAMHMMPNKSYPMYLLSKLYLQTGNSVKAKNMAMKVLCKPIKIETQAIVEIRNEMEKIIY
jgi:O-antigen polymerase